MRGSWKAGLSGQKMLVAFVLVAVVAMILSACGGGQVAGGGNGNAIPTPKPAESIGSGAKSAAKDTYQATWDSYLRDSIAAYNQTEDIKIGMLQRYELPSTTAQDVGGLIKTVDLVQDNTKFNTSTNNTASGLAKFDVKYTFENGDTDTRHCSFSIQIQQNQDDKLWYVVSPGPLAVQSVCAK